VTRGKLHTQLYCTAEEHRNRKNRRSTKHRAINALKRGEKTL